MEYDLKCAEKTRSVAQEGQQRREEETLTIDD